MAIRRVPTEYDGAAFSYAAGGPDPALEDHAETRLDPAEEELSDDEPTAEDFLTRYEELGAEAEAVGALPEARIINMLAWRAWAELAVQRIDRRWGRGSLHAPGVEDPAEI